MNSNRAFIGYYNVSSNGIHPVFSRSTITVPKTSNVHQTNTLYSSEQINTVLVNTLDTNELFPVEDLSVTYSNGYFTTLFNSLLEQVSNTGSKITVKIGLIVPNSGINKNIPCVEITIKTARTKNHFIVPITPMVPLAFSSTDWEIISSVGGSLLVNINNFPEDPSNIIPTTDEVTLFIYLDNTTTTSLAQFSLPNLLPNTINDFVLSGNTFTNGVTYYAELIAGNGDGVGLSSDRKSFIASM